MPNGIYQHRNGNFIIFYEIFNIGPEVNEMTKLLGPDSI